MTTYLILFGYGFDQEFRPGAGIILQLVYGGSERAVSLGDAGPHYAKAGGSFAMLHPDQVTAAQFTAKADQQASTDTDVSCHRSLGERGSFVAQRDNANFDFRGNTRFSAAF